MSAVYAWPLPEVTSITIQIKFVLPVSSLLLMVCKSTNVKLPHVLQLHSGVLRSEKGPH